MSGPSGAPVNNSQYQYDPALDLDLNLRHNVNTVEVNVGTAISAQIKGGRKMVKNKDLRPPPDSHTSGGDNRMLELNQVFQAQASNQKYEEEQHPPPNLDLPSMLRNQSPHLTKGQTGLLHSSHTPPSASPQRRNSLSNNVTLPSVNVANSSLHVASANAVEHRGNNGI